jgi:hypothetical protein
MKYGFLVLAAMMVVSGCSIVRGYYYDASSGVRADATPEMTKKVLRAKTICEGERAKIIATGTQSPATVAVMSDRVMDACMMQQGFELRPS